MGIRRFTALAVARAMLAGRHDADGLAARTRACLGAAADWQATLAARLGRVPGERWRRLTTRTLASLVEHDEGFVKAWASSSPPVVRRYVLRVGDRMQRPPLGLDTCQLPYWPNAGSLGDWLGVPPGGMWRLTRSPSWQRRIHLGDQHYRYRLLGKAAGGWRLLEVPLEHLMPLQRRLLDDLLDRVPPHEAAFGYARERSVVDHARAHVGQAVLLKFDLQDFFSSVRASRVQALFATLGYPDDVARDLARLCTTATPEPVLRRMCEAGQLTWQQVQRLRDAHLPQGAPTSPALANLCAFRLDLRLDGLAHELGARYTRYADDIVLSGTAQLRAGMPRIAAHVAAIAAAEGFAINHRKTRCQTAGRRQTVCNIVVNQRPNLRRDVFDRLKAILHRCVVSGPSTQDARHPDDLKSVLRGRIAWASQLNPAKARRLQSLFEAIDWAR